MSLSRSRTGLKKKLNLLDNNCQNKQVDKVTYFLWYYSSSYNETDTQKVFAETFKIKKKVAIYQVIILIYILLGIFLII